MNILNGEQMKATDEYTIKHLPIASIDLMEKAAGKCYEWITAHVYKSDKISVVCGPGNNGGDGLAISRMLISSGYSVICYLINPGTSLSRDCRINLERLKQLGPDVLTEISTEEQTHQLQFTDVIIDALFGTGLARPVNGLFGVVIDRINQTKAKIISIDLPSGLFTSETSIVKNNHIIKGNHTLTFHCLKPALLVGENSKYYGSVTVLDIGLTDHPDIRTNKIYIDHHLIASIYKPRPEFSNKGTFGHALLVAGGTGKMGAAILAANGYLKSGGGLLTIMVPVDGVQIIQTGVPEAMCLTYEHIDKKLTEKHHVVGIGPGIGTNEIACRLVEEIFDLHFQQYVIDADGLNCIDGINIKLDKIPPGSVLTPHPGEFKRLVGSWSNDFEKLDLQLQMSIDTNSIIILKGKNTTVACPDGNMFFNSTGNAGMAKGGSGDILTGLICGLLACNYSPTDAAILGVYLHGLAGDLAAEKYTQEAMNASDIISFIPDTWKIITQTGANQ